MTLGYFVLGCIYAPKLWETLQKGGPMQLVLQLLTGALLLQATASLVTTLHLRKSVLFLELCQFTVLF